MSKSKYSVISYYAANQNVDQSIIEAETAADAIVAKQIIDAIDMDCESCAYDFEEYKAKWIAEAEASRSRFHNQSDAISSFNKTETKEIYIATMI